MLGSFSYGTYLGVDEIPDDVLRLFADAAQKGKALKYPSEVVFAGLRGSIDTKRRFNLDAFERVIEKYQKLGYYSKKKKRELFLAISDEEAADYGYGVAEDRCSYQGVVDAYEALVDSKEFLSAVSDIRGLRDELLSVEHVDIYVCLKQAMKGITKAVDELKRLCNFYPRVAGVLEILLGYNGADRENLLSCAEFQF